MDSPVSEVKRSRGDRVNILNNLKWNGACFGLCLLGSALWSRPAAAEVTLVEKDGWSFSFDGRVNAFLSVGQGDDFPKPTVNPTLPMSTHDVMGSQGSTGFGSADVGWLSGKQQDADNKYFAMRVRSGYVGNVLGFGLKRNVTDTTTVKGYIAIWSTIETLGRDKWYPVIPELREGYFNINGPWGSLTAGRTFAWFGRTSAEIDFLYGHGYGVGLPCTDTLGPACGHTGTGVAFPGYSAGLSYSSPSMSGLQVHAGVYDPITFGANWKRAPYLRPEGSITFETPLGTAGKLKLGVEGLYQPLARVATDPVTMAQSDVTTSVWGASGGARLEVGPVRLGVSGFRGRGIGLTYALQNTSASVDTNTYELRTFSGFYGQGALVFGKVHLTAGGGVAAADQLASDRVNLALSTIHRQIGVSAAIYYSVSDSVVLGFDYFRFMARWYGAPAAVDDGAGNPVLGPNILTPEKQDLNFFNAGVTYHW